MKKIFVLLVSTLSILIGFSSISASTHVDCLLNVGHNITDENDTTYLTDFTRGRRVPPRMIQCTISIESGVDFIIDCDNDVLSYEIRNIDGFVIASLSDETEFVETLFSLSGDYEVLFKLDNLVLRGYVSL